MKTCNYNNLIDDYLMNKLNEAKKMEFEEHYFNCQMCFEKMEERNELIAVVKDRGKTIFKEERKEEKTRVFSFDKVFSFFSPKQWAVTTVTAALMLVIFLGVSPLLRKSTPQFVLDEGGRLRGESITLISPVIDHNTVPTQFKWKKLGEDEEYKIFLYSNDELIWSKSTKETFLALPDEIRNTMQAGIKYWWQIKAFSPHGALIAVSSKVYFTIVTD